MQRTKAFFQLIRWPNLIFVLVTQLLFHFCVYSSIYFDGYGVYQIKSILFITVASVCIAAAGYIINDYYDINIDLKNKPTKVIVSKIISRRGALGLHFLLNCLGICFTALAVNISTQWYLIIANMGVVLLLWIYSSNFKKQLLIGNILVSFFTAWTIFIVFFTKFSLINAFSVVTENQIKFFRITMLYAAFAFIITLIREAIKDVEDMEGDRRGNCKTMPIEWGVNATKVYICSWIIILLLLLFSVLVYLLQFKWWWFAVYILGALIFPLFSFFKLAIKAEKKSEFAHLSRYNKWITLLGILSMVLFYFYL